ncbi:hypothetical protein ABT282_07040 [Streptomyces sp. NPDC000927]|uniref:hypothetical protein n=1 Tax=Streptomyces sp. NPDC000927 TaxID=3154371 RepID=UPI00331E1062
MARVAEVMLVEPPKPPEKTLRKKVKKVSLVDQMKEALKFSPSSMVVDGIYDGGAAKAQKRFQEFLDAMDDSSIGTDSHANDIAELLNNTIGKAAARDVIASSLETLSNASKSDFTRRMQGILNDTLTVKAENAASSAAYQVNLGVPQRWNDTDDSLVSDDNPKGLKYYAAYRESSSTPGTFERVVGLRSHMPDAWADFVNAAGSRQRRAAKQDDVVEEQATDAVDDVADTEVADTEVANADTTADASTD